MRQLFLPRQDDPMRVTILMSGKGSNAEKIIDVSLEERLNKGIPYFEPVLLFTDNPDSRAEKIAKKNNITYVSIPIRLFLDESAKSREERRIEYDGLILETANRFKTDLLVLAGYDWVLSSEICHVFPIVNVHPGYLRKLDASGRPAYRGSGWIASAKAILKGEKEVYTTVHLVTPELDAGPILKISDPQIVPGEALQMSEDELFGEARKEKNRFGFINEYVDAHPGMTADEIKQRFPIYYFAKDCQERLKTNGDLIIFPQVIKDIANGRYSIDGKQAYFDGKIIA